MGNAFPAAAAITALCKKIKAACGGSIAMSGTTLTLNNVSGAALSTASITPSGIGAADVASFNCVKAFTPYGFQSKNAVTDFLAISIVPDSVDYYMQPMPFGSDTPGTTFGNSPYVAGPFYGVRFVYQNYPPGSTTGHLVTVVLLEQYPIAGRVWANTYDKNTGNWYGWVTTAQASWQLFTTITGTSTITLPSLWHELLVIAGKNWKYSFNIPYGYAGNVYSGINSGGASATYMRLDVTSTTVKITDAYEAGVSTGSTSTIIVYYR